MSRNIERDGVWSSVDTSRATETFPLDMFRETSYLSSTNHQERCRDVCIRSALVCGAAAAMVVLGLTESEDMVNPSLQTPADQ